MFYDEIYITNNRIYYPGKCDVKADFISENLSFFLWYHPTDDTRNLLIQERNGTTYILNLDTGLWLPRSDLKIKKEEARTIGSVTPIDVTTKHSLYSSDKGPYPYNNYFIRYQKAKREYVDYEGWGREEIDGELTKVTLCEIQTNYQGIMPTYLEVPFKVVDWNSVQFDKTKTPTTILTFKGPWQIQYDNFLRNSNTEYFVHSGLIYNYDSNERNYKSIFEDGPCYYPLNYKTYQIPNYSKKFGEFAINYFNFEKVSIGHNYKKIIEIDDHKIEGYTNDSIYFSRKGKKYRLYLKDFDNVQFKTIGNDQIIFNTTSYLNAFDNVYDNVYCSSDDWNGRCIFPGEDKRVASRLNNNWQTRKTILSVSSQYPSVLMGKPSKGYFVDENYTCPPNVTYDVFCDESSNSQTGVMSKVGEVTQSGFTRKEDSTKIFTNPLEGEQQINVPILDVGYSDAIDNVLVRVGDFTYTLLKQMNLGGVFVPMYLFQESGYSGGGYILFVVNGSLYTYYQDTNKIFDSNDQFVCDTSTLSFIGYTSKMALFYSELDHSIYSFTGDNTMTKLMSVERKNVVFEKDDFGIMRGNALYLPALDTIFVNFGDSFGMFYDEQFCIVNLNKNIENFSINKAKAILNVGEESYSLIKRNGFESVPIQFETEYFGNVQDETNTINDCVYISVSNLNELKTGTISIQTKALINQKVVTGKIKTFTLQKTDFNENGVCLIKYQSDIQECFGFKLIVKSDFEISEIKIGTSQGAMNQSKIKM